MYKTLLLVFFSCSPIFMGAAIGENEVSGPTLDQAELSVKKKDWALAVSQLRQVSHSERTKKWEELVEIAATGYLRSRELESRAGVEPLAESLTQSFPTLMRAKKFLSEKNRIILRGFQKCYESASDKQECTKNLLALIQRSQKETDFCLEASELVLKQGSIEIALSAFKLCLMETSYPKVCGNREFGLLVAVSFGSEKVGESQEARTIAETYCWPYMKTLIIKALNSRPSKGFIKNTCELLNVKKEFKEEQKKFCGRK